MNHPTPMSPRAERSSRLTRRRRIAACAAVAAALIANSTAAGAAGCTENGAAFPAGSWRATGISFARTIDDGVSSGSLRGELAFDLDVSTSGQVSGSYSGLLTGQLDGLTDSSSAGAVVIQYGDVSGTGARAEVTGSMGIDIDASIDVAGDDGVDFFSGGAAAYRGEVEIEQPFATTIAPSLANCGEAIGNLSSDPSAPAPFIAVRTGDSSDSPTDLALLVVEYLDAAERIDAAGPPDADQLAAGVELAEGIDAVIAAQESCRTVDLGSLDRGGTTRNLLSLVVADNLYEYTERAMTGDYPTADVIAVYTTATRGALFGGRPGTCTDEDPTASAGLRAAFERVLIQRWSEAVENVDHVAQLTIEAAAAQFAMTNLDDLIGASR